VLDAPARGDLVHEEQAEAAGPLDARLELLGTALNAVVAHLDPDPLGSFDDRQLDVAGVAVANRVSHDLGRQQVQVGQAAGRERSAERLRQLGSSVYSCAWPAGHADHLARHEGGRLGTSIAEGAVVAKEDVPQALWHERLRRGHALSYQVALALPLAQRIYMFG
jgi:hypothetical protein